MVQDKLNQSIDYTMLQRIRYDLNPQILCSQHIITIQYQQQLLIIYKNSYKMKRTKQSYFREHPDWNEQAGLSGLTGFGGEDNKFYERKNQYYQQNKEAYLTQMKQKQDIKQVEKITNTNFDKQELQNNRMKGLLEDKFRQAKREVFTAKQQQNLQLWKQKQLRQENERLQKIEEERQQLQLLNRRKVKRAVIPNEPK